MDDVIYGEGQGKVESGWVERILCIGVIGTVVIENLGIIDDENEVVRGNIGGGFRGKAYE